MSAPPTLTVLSLGGGVQSSVMALMAGESLPPTGSGGAFGRMPDCAIFADTHWEPPSVYEHIEWLKDRLRFPLYVVDNGAQPPRRCEGPSPTTQALAGTLTYRSI